MAEYARMWGPGGELQQRGLVPFGGAEAQAATAQASALQPLNAANLK
jgi:phosphate transport system substrate-binding protein